MLLSELIKALSNEPVVVIGEIELKVAGIVNDSRRVKPGFVFAAVPGVKQDGSTFVGEALERGAVALLVAKPLADVVSTQIVVEDVRQALGELVSAFYAHPSRSLRMFGVTGTNGKTTVTYFLNSILSQAGLNSGLIGTIETKYKGFSQPSTHTSPDSPDLQRTLKEMLDAGVEACAMELSSHALSLKRLAGSWFDGIAITNITHDHLDFHHTWEAYRDSKLSAFALLRNKPHGFVIANMHDKSFLHIKNTWRGRLMTFGFAQPADIRLVDSRPLALGSSLTIATPQQALTADINLPGAYNIANALAATGLAIAAGIEPEAIRLGLEALEHVPGRFQFVRGHKLTGVVDFAHNPDGLLQLLTTARALTTGRVILVFGCQGEKDTYKRPLMGEIAARWADEVILTTDDWFNEDPRRIFAMIIAGFRRIRGDGPEVVWRRDDAIFEAVSRAEPADLVVVAGRGPERKLVMGQVIYDFDDAAFLGFCIREREKEI